MIERTLHPGETAIDARSAAMLVARQFPQWTQLSVTALDHTGTDYLMFRLGEDKLIRLPRTASSANRVHKEQTWLPKFAPSLPLAIPRVLGFGAPAAEMAWPWSVFDWIAGDTPTQSLDAGDAARLAAFCRALHRLDPKDAPLPGSHNSFRGVALHTRDKSTRAALAQLAAQSPEFAAQHGLLLQAWQQALDAAPGTHACWIHGDLHPLNVLLRDDKLAAVIDFGLIAEGNPATDYMAAWTLLDAPARGAFFASLGADADAIDRARGWALSFAAIALPYYAPKAHPVAAVARQTLVRVCRDAAARFAELS